VILVDALLFQWNSNVTLINYNSLTLNICYKDTD